MCENILKNKIKNILVERINKENELKDIYEINKIYEELRDKELTEEELIKIINDYYDENKIKKLTIKLEQSCLTNDVNQVNRFNGDVFNSNINKSTIKIINKYNIKLNEQSNEEIIDIIIDKHNKEIEEYKENRNKIIQEHKENQNKIIKFIFICIIIIILILYLFYLVIKSKNI